MLVLLPILHSHVGGHPLLRRDVHMSSIVMQSKYFSSSSARCPIMVEGCWSACSRVEAWMSVRSSAARPFQYDYIMGWSVLEVSKICDRCFAMWPDM